MSAIMTRSKTVRRPFSQPTSEAALVTLLMQCGVDTTIWTKTTAQLFEEIEKGESFMEVDAAGTLSRVVKIANIVIRTTTTGKTLCESHQILTDGTTKNKKNGNLTEKVGFGETAFAGICRGVVEELGDMGRFVRNIQTIGMEGTEVKPSDSYKHLACVYKVNRFCAEWSGPVANFSTIDKHDGKQIFWVWI